MVGNFKSDASTDGLTNPVALHLLDVLWPVEFIQVVDEALSVGGDLEHPLLHEPPLYRVAGFYILSVFDLFVG